MNWEAIGAIGEIVGATGVIISLVYLAVQIRHSTKESELSTIHNISESYTAFMQEVAGNAELSKIWDTGLTNFSALNRDEVVRFVIIIGMVGRILDDAYLQFTSKRIGLEVWRSYENILVMAAKSDGFGEYWTRRRDMHTPEFIALVEKKMEEFAPGSDIYK